MVHSAFRELFEAGFEETAFRATAPEAVVKIRNRTTEVSACLLIGGTPWVKVARLATKEGQVTAGEAFAVTYLVEERAPDAASEIEKLAGMQPEKALRAQALWLYRYGRDVLEGDFGVFPRLRILADKHLARRERELYSSEGDG